MVVKIKAEDLGKKWGVMKEGKHKRNHKVKQSSITIRKEMASPLFRSLIEEQ